MTELRVEPCARRVRAYLGGHLVLDTVRASYVWEVPYYPAYYVPVDDVVAELVPAGDTSDVLLGGRTATGAAVVHTDGPLAGLVRLQWDAMDSWLEEDEPAHVHPRSPYVRVDVLASSRHVVVELDGVVVADSHAPRLLFETGLPVRYYLPTPDVRLDLLEPSTTTSGCPYKGWAEYCSVVLPGGSRFDDVVWGYRTPLPESRLVAGLLCFYNEKVDLVVDGVRHDRPATKFS